MRIRRAQEIEGMPAVKARNLLRAMMQVGGPVTVSYVARVLGVEGLKATEAPPTFALASAAPPWATPLLAKMRGSPRESCASRNHPWCSESLRGQALGLVVEEDRQHGPVGTLPHPARAHGLAGDRAARPLGRERPALDPGARVGVGPASQAQHLLQHRVQQARLAALHLQAGQVAAQALLQPGGQRLRPLG